MNNIWLFSRTITPRYDCSHLNVSSSAQHPCACSSSPLQVPQKLSHKSRNCAPWSRCGASCESPNLFSEWTSFRISHIHNPVFLCEPFRAACEHLWAEIFLSSRLLYKHISSLLCVSPCALQGCICYDNLADRYCMHINRSCCACYLCDFSGLVLNRIHYHSAHNYISWCHCALACVDSDLPAF